MNNEKTQEEIRQENNLKANALEVLLKLPISKGLLKIKRSSSDWLEVEYQENLSFTPSEDGSRWSLVCAQDLTNETIKSLNDRVILMLAEQLRSARQDANGLMTDKRRNENKALIELAENLDNHDYNIVINILRNNRLLILNA